MQEKFKFEKDVYILHKEDEYIMLSKNPSRCAYKTESQAIMVYNKASDVYIKAIFNTTSPQSFANSIVNVDYFEALLFLDIHFPDEMINKFLEAVEELKHNKMYEKG